MVHITKKYFLILIILIPIFIFGVYKFIKSINYKNPILNLSEYILVPSEKIIKEIKHNGKKYLVSIYYDDTSSWSHINFLLKENQKYYILENVKKCDIVDDGNNIYVKDNEIYIHCIGKEGNIDKYLINNLNIETEKINFNFKNTPNISQLHIGIDNIDNEYMYLSSPFKVDNTINDKPKVKCSLYDKICLYY